MGVNDWSREAFDYALLQYYTSVESEETKRKRRERAMEKMMLFNKRYALSDRDVYALFTRKRNDPTGSGHE